MPATGMKTEFKSKALDAYYDGLRAKNIEAIDEAVDVLLILSCNEESPTPEEGKAILDTRGDYYAALSANGVGDISEDWSQLCNQIIQDMDEAGLDVSPYVSAEYYEDADA